VTKKAPALRGMQSLKLWDLNCLAINGQCYPYLAALTNLKRSIHSFGIASLPSRCQAFDALTKIEKLKIYGTRSPTPGWPISRN
jgi:hypothetical protein